MVTELQRSHLLQSYIVAIYVHGNGISSLRNILYSIYMGNKDIYLLRNYQCPFSLFKECIYNVQYHLSTK